MNGDPLESELESIRPRPLSEGFMPRFERRLSAARSVQRLNRILTAGLAAAACIAVMAVALHRARAPHPRLVHSHPIERATPEPLPTVAVYQRAYQQSPEAFEALLQQRPVGATERPVDHSYDVVRYDIN